MIFYTKIVQNNHKGFNKDRSTSFDIKDTLSLGCLERNVYKVLNADLIALINILELVQMEQTFLVRY